MLSEDPKVPDTGWFWLLLRFVCVSSVHVCTLCSKWPLHALQSFLIRWLLSYYTDPNQSSPSVKHEHLCMQDIGYWRPGGWGGGWSGCWCECRRVVLKTKFPILAGSSPDCVQLSNLRSARHTETPFCNVLCLWSSAAYLLLFCLLACVFISFIFDLNSKIFLQMLCTVGLKNVSLCCVSLVHLSKTWTTTDEMANINEPNCLSFGGLAWSPAASPYFFTSCPRCSSLVAALLLGYLHQRRRR